MEHLLDLNDFLSICNLLNLLALLINLCFLTLCLWALANLYEDYTYSRAIS